MTFFSDTHIVFNNFQCDVSNNVLNWVANLEFKLKNLSFDITEMFNFKSNSNANTTFDKFHNFFNILFWKYYWFVFDKDKNDNIFNKKRVNL